MDPRRREEASRTDDTDPAIEAILIKGYRRMSPAQKLERVRALTRAVQQLALLDIRRPTIASWRCAWLLAGSSQT